jgi:GcrA cell cycle regulator
MTSPWTDEVTATLRRLYAEGRSYGQIKAELDGISRNAIVGKVHRLSLEKRDKPAVQPARRMSRRVRKPARVATPERAERLSKQSKEVAPETFGGGSHPSPDPEVLQRFPTQTLPGSEPVALLDLKFNQCRWPLKETAVIGSLLFCGAKASTRPWGQSACPYCDEHADMAVSRKAA